MHTYSNLWNNFANKEHIRKCVYKAAEGKYDRNQVKKIIKNIDEYVDHIYDYVNDFHNYDHEPVHIKDGSSGKDREIIVPLFDEHVVHHMIVDSLMPMFTRGMYTHTYSSIPGRGLHKCSKKIRAWIQNDPKGVKYCLKMDIRKFFNSIDHNVLRNELHKYINDQKMLDLLDILIEATKDGIPLGFYTSHWFANWLLQSLDHLIVEVLDGVAHYARYMDDMVVFGSNKRKLHRVKDRIEEWLNDRNMNLKDNWQVFRFDYIKDGRHYGRPLDFIGFEFWRDKTLLRKSLMLKLTRKASKINKKGFCTIHDARQLMSYFGWVDWADCYKLYVEYVSPYIQIKKCRDYISQYDKMHIKLQKQILKEVA